MSEYVSRLPLLDQVADELKQNGLSEKEFTDSDVSEIMKALIRDLLSSQDSVRAVVKEMAVIIQGGQGRVRGFVDVQKPMNVGIGLDLLLFNGKKTDVIRSEILHIQKKANIFKKGLMGIVDVEGRIRERLADPNIALFEALSRQMAPRGAGLTRISLQFEDRKLQVALSGHPLQAKR